MVGGPVTSRIAAWVVVLAAGLVVAACASAGPPAPVSPLNVDDVVPQTNLAPLAGGATLPDPAQVLLIDADTAFAQRDYAGLVASSDRTIVALAAVSSTGGTSSTEVSPSFAARPDGALPGGPAEIIARSLRIVGLTGSMPPASVPPDQLAVCGQIPGALSGALSALGAALGTICHASSSKVWLARGQPERAQSEVTAAAVNVRPPVPAYLQSLCTNIERSGGTGACVAVQAAALKPAITTPPRPTSTTPTTSRATSTTSPWTETSERTRTRTTTTTAPDTTTSTTTTTPDTETPGDGDGDGGDGSSDGDGDGDGDGSGGGGSVGRSGG